MNPLNQAQATTEPTEAETVETQEAETTSKQETLQDVKKTFYGVDKLEQASEDIAKWVELAQAENALVQFNFDTDADFPEGYGLVLGPINKRVDNKTKVIGVYVAAIPTIETLQAEESGKGANWVLEAVQDALAAKVANAVRPRADGNAAASVPFTVEDFITSNRPEGLLVAFNELAPSYVKLLKGKGLKRMTNALLRSVLESKAFAEQQFPKVPQASWEKLLDSMIDKAAKDGMTVGAMQDWKESRDTAGLPDADVDLSGLDFSEV